MNYTVSFDVRGIGTAPPDQYLEVMLPHPDSDSWDRTTTTSERSALNTLLGLSESTTGWTYDDLTSSEMSELNTLLGLSESTTGWDSSLTVNQYLDIGDSMSTCNMKVTEPDSPQAEDYAFAGWYPDIMFDEPWDFENDHVRRSITLYALWERTTPDWHGNRFSERFTYKRVAWENWQEHETYNFITRGSVEQSAESTLKVTGSFDFEGYELPDVNDLIRIYYHFRDDDGLTADEPIATLFVSYASIVHKDTVSGVLSLGTLEGSSVLSVLEDKVIGVPKTITKNANAVYEAEQLVRECGLLTNAEPSAFTLSADHTFDAGTSCLDIVNWLLSAAGYTECYPDAMGIVQMKSYFETQQRIDYIVFANNEESIMYPEIEDANDWQTAPNVVRLIYNTDEACIAAYAINLTGSKASLDARGNREITLFEEIAELGEGTSKANALKEQAETLLLEKSCDIEYVTFNHAYKPLMIYDPVKVVYSDKEWTGNVDNISIDLAPATKTQTKIKKVLYQNIEINSGATVYREI